MLKSISCDIFNKKNRTISLHTGLNTVLGTNDGANSIGKSTLLMIIDFCFGGDDYVYRCKEVMDIMGHHTIRFNFFINNKDYYFSRSTNDPEFVTICDSNYKTVSVINNTDYCKMLSDLYGIEKQTLRNAVGPFFRIYHRETLNENKPINAAFREANADSIARLFKLFGKYGNIEESQKKYLEEKEKQNVIKRASDFKYVKKINENQYQKNLKRIDKIKELIGELVKDINDEKINRDDIDRERRIELNNKRSLLLMERDMYKIENIRIDNKKSPMATEKDFELLNKYFSNVQIEEIQKIEDFHNKIYAILKGEYDDLVKQSEANIKRIDAELKKLEEEYKKLESLTNVSDSVLDEHHRLTKELDELERQNAFYKSTEDVDKNVKTFKEDLDKVVSTVAEEVQNSINDGMKKLNDDIYNGQKTCPRIKIDLLDRYFFSTPADSGTGTQQRGVAIFDLVMLSKTQLPAFAHDSVMLKHIEDGTLAKLFEYYNKTSKQVFIAFDRASTYPLSIELLNESKIIELGRGENALFGRDFNEIKE